MNVKNGIILGIGLFVFGGVLMSLPKRLNKAGLAAIKSYEGLSLVRYNDVAGYPTIGYGHLILPHEEFHTISLEEAEALFIRDVMVYEDAVNENVKVPLTQNMFNALVSFCYNVGVDQFRNSTLLRVLNAGDYIEANNQLARWNRAGGKVVEGLANRREHEQQLFWA